MIAALLLLVSLLVGAQEKQLLFETPSGLSDADKLKAAKALVARCVAHGLAGVTGDLYSSPEKPVKKVRVTAPKGFAPESVPVVEFLASVPCRTVEIRFEHFLSAAQEKEFKQGVNAPAGSTWTKLFEWKSVAEPFPRLERTELDYFTLVRDRPVLDLSKAWKFHRHPGGDLFGSDREAGIFLTFRGPLVKSIYGGIVKKADSPTGTMLPAVLFIDGARVPTDDGMMGWRILDKKSEDPDLCLWTFPELVPRKPLAILLEFPLPFALKRAE